MMYSLVFKQWCCYLDLYVHLKHIKLSFLEIIGVSNLNASKYLIIVMGPGNWWGR
jgi:hypothetical protein